MSDKIALYQVKFHYKDGKEVNINIVPPKLDPFLENLNHNQVFWNNEETAEESKDNGFWTNVEDIRFVQIQSIKGVEEHDGHASALPSSTEVRGEEKETTEVAA